MNRLLPALLLALLLPGCWVARAQVNAPLAPAQLEGIAPGRTTAEQVVELLGAPAEVVQLGRKTAYRYQHTISKGLSLWLLVVFFQNQDTQSDRVWIWFDEQNVVSHLGASFESGEARYALPWMDRD